jgi:Putative Ig domain/Galactose oxidase, central domain
MNKNQYRPVVLVAAACLSGCGGGGNDGPATSSSGSNDRYGNGNPTQLFVSGIPTPTPARVVLMFQVQAVDSTGHSDVWNGTVHVSTTDPAAIVNPSDITVSGGIGSGKITFETSGAQTITASAGSGGLQPWTYTTNVVVPPPLAIASGALPNAVVGQGYNPQVVLGCVASDSIGECLEFQPESFNFFALKSIGGVEDGTVSWTWSAQPQSTLPPGLNVQPPSACCGWAITGTPTKAGSYQVSLTASDSGSPSASATVAYTLTVAPAQPPVISSVPAPQGGTVNQGYSYNFAISGVAPVTVAETGALPAGLTLSPGGELSGTPSVAGSFPVSVTATDGLGQTTTMSFTVQVFQNGFTNSGALTTARVAHSATLMGNGRILVAGGLVTNDLPTDTSELYDTGAQTAAASVPEMIETRSNHTATLLCDLSHSDCSNALVLVAGGRTSDGGAELYDPVADTFAPITLPMSEPHFSGTATLLTNGQVLVAGGETAALEFFDPASRSFLAPLTMSAVRTRHTATLLASGKVLITGGYNQAAAFLEPGSVLSSAEIYDPVAGTIAAAGNMIEARASHSATLLQDGRVLLAGGYNNTGPLATAEIYDPTTGSFTAIGNLVTPRSGHTAVLLPSGLVLLAGGQYLGRMLPHAELFDPVKATFSNTGSLQVPRILHTMTAFGIAGQVQVMGGIKSPNSEPLQSTEVYQ